MTTVDLKLHEKIKYVLLSCGKRLRPLIVILSTQSVGGNRDEVMPLALAIELLHAATLVHDDIIDEDEFRRGILAVQEKLSVNDAILVGDALISIAINLAADHGKEIVKILSDTSLSLCDGECMDLSIKLIKTSEKEYFKKISNKSASLFKASAKCGAIAGGGTDYQVKCLTHFGEHFGIAYQLSDDLSDLTCMKEDVPKDLTKRRISLPLIHLHSSKKQVEREILLNDLQSLARNDSGFENIVLKKVLLDLEINGSTSYCGKKIHEYINQSWIFGTLEILISNFTSLNLQKQICRENFKIRSIFSDYAILYINPDKFNKV